MGKLIFFLLFAASLSAQTVYKTPSGKKYHTADCHMVKNKSAALSILEALDLQLEPCKICKPDTSTSTAVKSNTSGEKTTSTQCKGRTKKGTRCRHMTKIGNGYCYQHQSQL